MQFQQLKNYFHISKFFRIKQFMTRFYKKMKSMIIMIQNNFRTYCTLASSIVIDEIIIRFIDRSKHIVIIRDKFCSVNFNILILCEVDYYYDFVFNNSKIDFADVFVYFERILISEIFIVKTKNYTNNTKMTKIMSEINRIFLYLMLLLFQNRHFIVYCDNFFTNANLFHVLHYYDFVACDTVRANNKN